MPGFQISPPNPTRSEIIHQEIFRSWTPPRYKTRARCFRARVYLFIIQSYLCAAAAHAGIHDIPQCIAHQVPSEDEQDQSDTRIYYDVPVLS